MALPSINNAIVVVLRAVFPVHQAVKMDVKVDVLVLVRMVVLALAEVTADKFPKRVSVRRDPLLL